MERIKISLLSDSHDNIKNLQKSVQIANKEKCTHIFHLGDIVSPMTAGVLKGFKGDLTGIFGNCDGDKLQLHKVFNKLGGRIENPPLKIVLNKKLFILMHEPWLIEEVIKSGEADFIFYGHTHEDYFRREGKTVIINPGEVSGIKNDPTFYILDINKEHFEKIEL